MDAAEVLHQLWHVAGGLAIGRVVALWWVARRARRLAAEEAAVRLGGRPRGWRRRGYRARAEAWLQGVQIPVTLRFLLFAVLVWSLACLLSED